MKSIKILYTDRLYGTGIVHSVCSSSWLSCHIITVRLLHVLSSYSSLYDTYYFIFIPFVTSSFNPSFISDLAPSLVLYYYFLLIIRLISEFLAELMISNVAWLFCLSFFLSNSIAQVTDLFYRNIFRMLSFKPLKPNGEYIHLVC